MPRGVNVAGVNVEGVTVAGVNATGVTAIALDADISVFIYLLPFLRYKLKRECVATQTRFLTSGGHNSSTRKLKQNDVSAESHMSQLCNEINHIFVAHIVLTKELNMFT